MNGGYVLLREPALISVYDIITLMEGAPGIPESAGRADGDTTLHTALSLMNGDVEAYLRALTLDKLADKNSRKWRNEIADKVEQHIDSLLPKG
jgi:DNA-binding IscR family transcriptional regulator